MLSQYEQRQLYQIEQELELSDPGLARAISWGVTRRSTRKKSGPADASRATTSLRVLLDVLAVALIILGALTMNVLLIFAGAVTLAAAVAWHLPSGGTSPKVVPLRNATSHHEDRDQV